MIVLALVLFAMVLAVTAWVVRRSSPGSAPAESGDRHLTSARLDDHVGHLRTAGRAIRTRVNGAASNGVDSNGADPLLGAPIVVPEARYGESLTDSYVQGFDLRSVTTFATRFYGCVIAAFTVGLVVLWVLASLIGLVSAFESFMRGIGFSGFSFVSLQFFFGICLLALAFEALMVAMTVVSAALYNVLAHRYGGVRMFVSDTSVAPHATVLAGNGNGHGHLDDEIPLRRAASDGDRTVLARIPRRAATRSGNGARPNGAHPKDRGARSR